jgi:hypothetical protein
MAPKGGKIKASHSVAQSANRQKFQKSAPRACTNCPATRNLALPSDGIAL